MESAFQEALNLFLRWLHVIAAIMWIGDSFLFMWMDSHLEKPSRQREGPEGAVVGELWLTHSGGFYEIVKRKFLGHDEMPKNLYWFKWESYTTWITGFFLLFVVYYLNGSSYLVDPTISSLTTAEGILLSLGLLIGGWIVYDVLWSSPLGKRPGLLGPACFLVLVALAFWLTQLYSGRAAYLQIGAMMGTIMSANVFFRIIPAQRNMLASTRAGTPVDTSLGVRAKGRSRHNHYMTLPVLFCMLSNHFPATFTADAAWVILGIVFLFGAGLKYIMNYRGQAGFVVWFGTIVSFVLIIALTTGRSIAVDSAESDLLAKKVSFPVAHRIINTRCAPCHSLVPTDPGMMSPPAGVVFDKPAQIVKMAPRILERVFATRSMPPGNKTGISDEERAIVAAWIKQGAKVDEAPRWEGAAPPPELVAKAKTFYADRCATCHGATGLGDGPIAKGLMPRPASLRDHAWHQQISDDELVQVIVNGGPALKKSPLMTPSLDLEEDAALAAALVHVVRTFEDKPPPPPEPPAPPAHAVPADPTSHIPPAQ